jgi:NADH-quinone oxidoreductase subunit A
VQPLVPAELELTQYTAVFFLLALAVVVVVAMLAVAWLLAPRNADPVKGLNYECGEVPLGSAWLRFNIRFYLVALVFVLFDVELALVYPVAVILRETANAPGGTRAGIAVLGELFFFMAVLLLGLIYVWRKGDLGWARSFRPSRERGLRSWERAVPPEAEKP